MAALNGAICREVDTFFDEIETGNTKHLLAFLRGGEAMKHVVLVVDDDPMVLEVLADMLEDLGCDVLTAHGGAEALEALGSNIGISILITDINMPGMDGHELAERAKRLRPELRILQLSGRERRRDAYPMIRKPFDEQELARVMEQTVGLC